MLIAYHEKKKKMFYKFHRYILLCAPPKYGPPILPVEHFEWHNLGPVASYKYHWDLSLIPNNLHEFHRPEKYEYSEIIKKKKQKKRSNASHIIKLYLKGNTRTGTFFCISNSNLMFSSVTILGILPATASGIVANMSWKQNTKHC